MKITVLMENSTPSDRICARHGLSLFLETATHRVLFDMGPDAAFLDNARALSIDVATADVAVLSTTAAGWRPTSRKQTGCPPPLPYTLAAMPLRNMRPRRPRG